jgi:hypothetical protein
MKKQKNICIPRISKKPSQNFSSFLDFRLILSITAQSIFAEEPRAWARWKSILIENIKTKKNNIFFYLG